MSASNAAYLKRVTEAWAETTLTWENQPKTDTAGQITLAQSDSITQIYELDVKGMIAGMVKEPSKNHGFMLQSVHESPHNMLPFASSDNADSALHPKLMVRYKVEVPTQVERIGSPAAAPAYALEGKQLRLISPMQVRLTDLSGRSVTEISANGTLSLFGLRSGAYIVRTSVGAFVVAVP